VALAQVAPLVSIIIPTHISRPPFLAEALASVIAQDWTNWEVIVVDDGSPDPGALAELVNVDGRIRVVRQDRGGVARARNRGLAHARGDLVAFLDYDDVWYPRHLSTAVEALAAGPGVVAAYTAFDVVTGYNKKFARTVRAEGPTTRHSVYSGGDRPSINTLVARRHAVAAVGGMDPAVEGADDLDLMYKLAERGSFAYLDEVTSAYRLHDHNASRDTRRMASALDRAIYAHLQRALDAADTEAAADLTVGRRAARRFYSQTALRNASAAARSGHFVRGAALAWWAVRFSPASAATAVAQGTRRQVARLAHHADRDAG
jgi:glycosyltransferase involved in cell wall biosynthesis